MLCYSVLTFELKTTPMLGNAMETKQKSLKPKEKKQVLHLRARRQSEISAHLET